MGNALYNGTLVGAATLNNTSPQCGWGYFHCNNTRIANNYTSGTDSAYTSNTDSVKTKKEFVIFPNPAKNNLTIHYPSEIDGSATIKIINTLGAVTNTYNRELIKGSNYINLSTNGLNEGVYFIQLSVGKAVSTKQIFIHK